MEKALLVFAKKPSLGKVKTRLAQDIGHEKALSIYKQLLFHTFDIAAQTEALVIACFTEKDDWTLDSIPYNTFYEQTEGDLGLKMHKALEFAFKQGAKKAIVIGTDCPDITTGLIEEAYQKLNTSDVVFGPAEDGGYYLIGMKSLETSLFQDIEWSTEKVLKQSIAKLEQSSISYCLLPSLNDIDTLEDLKKTHLYNTIL